MLCFEESRKKIFWLLNAIVCTVSTNAASQKLVKCFMFPESVPLFSGVLPKYFNSEWSVAQFRLHENIQYIVAFGHQKNTVVILGMDGRYVSSNFHVNILYLCMYIAYSWSGDYFHLSECILYSKTLRRVKQR